MRTTIVTRVRTVRDALGWRGIARRASYLVRLRSGELARRSPAAAWYDDASPVHWGHRFDLSDIRARYAELDRDGTLRAAVVSQADRVVDGELQIYGGDWHPTSWPPHWHVNPFTGRSYPRLHWTRISDDDPDRGDIKDVWEPSRLPFTFLFARAYASTGDGRYPAYWWEAIEDWAGENPPNVGVNWRCGQESSLRAIALCFGVSTFADDPSSTPARLGLVSRILGASVARVRPTLGYALSQRNNHAVSELVFLLSVRAPGERRLFRLLLEVLDDQFYPDGSYSQQSFTYQRLAVQALQWLLATRLDLPPGLRSRVVEALARSRDFLARCSDPVSGWLPNYGPNDGSMLFHLSSAHYRDFRPLLTQLGKPSSRAIDREPAIWLPLPDVEARRTSADEEPTTYRTLRGPRSLAFTRVGTGHHREAHGDQQALDLWIDGRNIVVDPGTYRYSAPPPWRNALSGPEVHALPRGHGEETLSVGRFLTSAMPSAVVVHHGPRDGWDVIVSKRPVEPGWLWRAIARSGDDYVVVDAAGVDATVRWNLGALAPVDVHLLTAGRVTHLEPDETDPGSGWSSEVYARREPIDVAEVAVARGGVAVARFTRRERPRPALGALANVLGDLLPNVAIDELAALVRSGPSSCTPVPSPREPDASGSA
jgi:hypothetical protein